MQFQPGQIHDILWKPLKKFHDKRGWLCELFRHDELPAEFHPAMAYISLTEPGVARGPHEHVDQADYFCFLGPGDFDLYLWDTRPQSPTYLVRQKERVGAERPVAVVVPPGVVHAYRNVSGVPGIVFNAPNRLYLGWGRKGWLPALDASIPLPPGKGVDEIRHEEDPQNRFPLD